VFWGGCLVYFFVVCGGGGGGGGSALKRFNTHVRKFTPSSFIFRLKTGAEISQRKNIFYVKYIFLKTVPFKEIQQTVKDLITICRHVESIRQLGN